MPGGRCPVVDAGGGGGRDAGGSSMPYNRQKVVSLEVVAISIRVPL